MAHPLIDTLPGFPSKISAVLPSLAKAWADEGEDAGRASQMNLVMMFGSAVTPEDAQARFDDAIRFAQRYPCRLIILAARPNAEADVALEAKVNVLCFFDPARRGKRCCEALMLAHGKVTRELESLVSIWLEADLPVNLWVHGATVEEFNPWLQWTARCRRVIANRSQVGDDFFGLPFPKPNAVRDISVARCLHFRQVLGQYFATHSPSELFRGLRHVKVLYRRGLHGEALGIMEWMRGCLTHCAGLSRSHLDATFATEKSVAPEYDIRIEWNYADEARFIWNYSEAHSHASIAFTRSHDTRTHIQRVAFMNAAEALSEAVFF